MMQTHDAAGGAGEATVAWWEAGVNMEWFQVRDARTRISKAGLAASLVTCVG